MSHLKVAVMPGDGIGKEITAPSVELVKEAAHQCEVELEFFEIEAGAQYFLDTRDFSFAAFSMRSHSAIPISRPTISTSMQPHLTWYVARGAMT